MNGDTYRLPDIGVVVSVEESIVQQLRRSESGIYAESVNGEEINCYIPAVALIEFNMDYWEEEDKHTIIPLDPKCVVEGVVEVSISFPEVLPKGYIENFKSCALFYAKKLKSVSFEGEESLTEREYMIFTKFLEWYLCKEVYGYGVS